MRPLATEFRPNPNGRASNHPERIVLHAMGEYLDPGNGQHPMHAPDFLEYIGLSTHIIVTPDPSPRLIRCRDDEQGAYHAKGHNTNSLGIELLVTDAPDLARLKERTAGPWVGAAQFQLAARQVAHWCRTWGIPLDRIHRHSDLDPDRKWFDPGDGFPSWGLFIDEVKRYV